MCPCQIPGPKPGGVWRGCLEERILLWYSEDEGLGHVGKSGTVCFVYNCTQVKTGSAAAQQRSREGVPSTCQSALGVEQSKVGGGIRLLHPAILSPMAVRSQGRIIMTGLSLLTPTQHIVDTYCIPEYLLLAGGASYSPAHAQ